MRSACPALGLALAVLLAAAPAFAGARITAPFGEARRDSLGPDGLPVPEVAASLSANSTLVPFAVGGLGFVGGAAAGSGWLVLIGAGAAALGVVAGPTAG